MRWTFQRATDFSRSALVWDATNASCQGLPFLQAAFVQPLLKEFGTGREMLILGMDGESAVAAGLVAPKGPGIWETFQPSQLPVGAWLLKREADASLIMRDLLRHLPGFALSVGITQQDPIVLSRPAETPRLRTLDYIQTAWVDVGGSFEDYWNARGKNLRSNMRKQRAKLDSDGVSTRLETLSAPADVAEAIRDYGVLESSGWKAAGGTAIHPDNAQGRFYRAMLEAFCQQGAGRIYRYRFGEKIVAVDLCIEGGGALVILKTTYDETIKAFSPALLMRQDAFKTLFEERRIKRVEFYGKLMEWHTRWTDNARTLYHINVYRWSWLPKLQQIASRLQRSQVKSAPTTVREDSTSGPAHSAD